MEVYLNDIDITEYIQGNSLVLTTSRPDYGQVLVNPIPSLVGIDTESFWDVKNPVSIFYHVNDFSVFNVEIYDEGQKLFDGFIQSLNRQTNEMVNIELQTPLQQALSKNVIYPIPDSFLNPAEIFIDLCNRYDFKFDALTTQKASNLYNTNSIQCTAAALKADISIISFLEAIAQVGIAAIYAIGDVLYFDAYGTTKTPLLTLSDDVSLDYLYILDSPIIKTIYKDIPTSYSITYRDQNLSELDIVENYGDLINPFQLSAGQDDLVTIESLASAIWVGDQWLDYLSRPNIEYIGPIETALAKDINVGDVFTLNLSSQTTTQNYLITELSIQNDIRTNMRAVYYDI